MTTDLTPRFDRYGVRIVTNQAEALAHLVANVEAMVSPGKENSHGSIVVRAVYVAVLRDLVAKIRTTPPGA